MSDEHAICRMCFRPEATDEDWDKVPEGEGEHLCFGQGNNCYDGRDEHISGLESALHITEQVHWQRVELLDKEIAELRTENERLRKVFARVAPGLETLILSDEQMPIREISPPLRTQLREGLAAVRGFALHPKEPAE